MKIIIANHGIYPHQVGGMERHTYNLAANLAQIDGIELKVLVPAFFEKKEFPFSLHTLPWGKTPVWLYNNYLFSCAVRDFAKTYKPDIILSQGFNAWACLKSKEWRIVFHPHGLEMFGQHLSLKERVLLWPFRKLVEYHGAHAQRTISLGGKLTNILHDQAKIPTSKLVEIPNAVNLDEFCPSGGPRHEKSFLFVGRLAFNKGIDFLPKILKSVVDPEFKLTIAGSGPAENQVRALLSQDSRVTFIPNASPIDLKKLYAEHACLLFTSRFEGMPTVILEAMASGMMIVATDIGAVRVMFNEEVGFIVEPNADALSQAINEVIKIDAPKKKRMQAAARLTAEKCFSWDKVVSEYVHLFQEMLR